MDEKKLGTQNIIKLMLSYSLPAIVVITAFSVYNIADGIFIGRTVGSDGLAAVSISSPILVLFACISCVVGTGGNALVGIALGEGDRHKASERFSLAAAVMLIFIMIFSILLIIFTRPIAMLIGANDAIIDGATIYLRTTGFFCFAFLLAGYLGLSMETAGKPVVAMVANVIGVTVNLVLDYIFIMKLNMGLFGAALSSGIGATLTCVIFLSVIFMPSTALKFVKTKFDYKIIGLMLYNGMSEGLSAFSASITSLLYNIVIMRRLGETGLAAFAVIQYCFIFISSVMSGASQGISPIISYNFGAKNFKRIKSTLKVFTITNVIIAVGSIIFLLINRGWMFGLFSDGTAGTEALSYKISNFYAITFLFIGLNDIYIAYFTAIANARTSAGLATVRVLVLKGMFIIILPFIFGSNGIWMTSPLSEFVALVLCSVFIHKSVKGYEGRLTDVNIDSFTTVEPLPLVKEADAE